MFTLCCKQNNGGSSMGGTIVGQLKESCGVKDSGKKKAAAPRAAEKEILGNIQPRTMRRCSSIGERRSTRYFILRSLLLLSCLPNLKQCAFLFSTEQPCVFNWRNSNTEPFRSQQTCKASKEILRTLSEDCSHEFKQGRSKWRKGRCHGRAHALLRRYQRRNAFA